MTQPDIRFRDAVPGDEALVADFVLRLARYEKLEHEAVGTAEDFARALFGPRPHAYALIVEKAGEPVGFALWYYDFSTFHARPGLYLEDVFVAREHRGGGIGRRVGAEPHGFFDRRELDRREAGTGQQRAHVVLICERHRPGGARDGHW